jgi:hypothetical protein
MLGFLRRHQPPNPLLAVLYWAGATLVVLALLFVAFYYLDNFLPGQGMF